MGKLKTHSPTYCIMDPILELEDEPIQFLKKLNT